MTSCVHTPSRNANLHANVSYNLDTPSATCEPEDPLYSVIADNQIATPVPPQLPAERTHYYQEIESDQPGTDHETPIKFQFTPQNIKQLEEGENVCHKPIGPLPNYHLFSPFSNQDTHWLEGGWA